MTDKDQYEEFFWKGQKRYKCNREWEGGAPCEFDSYDIQVLLKHAAEPHNLSGKPALKRTVLSPIVGSDGQPIVRESEEFKAVEFKADEG